MTLTAPLLNLGNEVTKNTMEGEVCHVGSAWWLVVLGHSVAKKLLPPSLFMTAVSTNIFTPRQRYVLLIVALVALGGLVLIGLASGQKTLNSWV